MLSEFWKEDGINWPAAAYRRRAFPPNDAPAHVGMAYQAGRSENELRRMPN
jgi:hypothetical protein